jgi:hypothetical protein
MTVQAHTRRKKHGKRKCVEVKEYTRDIKPSDCVLRDKVVCLCGSTKPEWRAKYREVLEKLTLMGNAVFTVVWFRGDFKGDFEVRRPLMENVYFLKIASSEAVVVIDREAVGEHTRQEMAYARKLGIPVYYFDQTEKWKVRAQ